jgi:hypothetical protein
MSDPLDLLVGSLATDSDGRWVLDPRARARLTGHLRELRGAGASEAFDRLLRFAVFLYEDQGAPLAAAEILELSRTLLPETERSVRARAERVETGAVAIGRRPRALPGARPERRDCTWRQVGLGVLRP